MIKRGSTASSISLLGKVVTTLKANEPVGAPPIGGEVVLITGVILSEPGTIPISNHIGVGGSPRLTRAGAHGLAPNTTNARPVKGGSKF